MSHHPSLPHPIQAALQTKSVQEALAATINHFGCQAGTLHRLAAEGQLALAASVNIPPPVVALVQSVPVGKGIAGLAAERLEPVSLCNLQTDTSGQARPGAKQTGMEGSIAVPMLVDGRLHGVLGIAKATAYDWPDEERALLLAIGSAMAEILTA